MRLLLRAGVLSLILALALVVDGVAAGPSAHFGLSKSAPEEDSSVSELTEVRLWFTQVPQDGSMSVRIVDGDGELVEAPNAAQDAEDGKVFFVALEGGLPAGSYTVRWRGIGQDGHVVRGDFGFAVTGD